MHSKTSRPQNIAVLLGRLAVLSEIKPSQRHAALLVLAVAPACLINAVGGQCGVLTAILMISGILLIDRRPAVAGVLPGLLASSRRWPW